MFWEMPSNINKVLESDSEKEERQTNDGLTIHCLDLAYL
jgi:hypothetical protein